MQGLAWNIFATMVGMSTCLESLCDHDRNVHAMTVHGDGGGFNSHFDLNWSILSTTHHYMQGFVWYLFATVVGMSTQCPCAGGGFGSHINWTNPSMSWTSGMSPHVMATIVIR